MILVTGGTGMLGSYLLYHLLQKGEKVVALKRKSSQFDVTKTVFSFLSNHPDKDFNSIEWLDADLFNYYELLDLTEGVRDIYHCAAIINYSSKNPDEQIINNREITRNLVNVALERQVERFCHISSIAALGGTSDGTPVTEQVIWETSKRHTHYSVSKYESEMEVWRAISEGLNATIVNPSVILGAGDWNRGSANLIKKIADGFKYYTLGSTGFVDARDVVSICYQLMHTPQAFGQSFILNADNLKYQKLFQYICDAAQQKPPYIYASPFITNMVWRYEKWKSFLLRRTPILTKESSETAHKQLAYSSEKLHQYIDFEYTKVQKTLKDLIEFYRTF